MEPQNQFENFESLVDKALRDAVSKAEAKGIKLRESQRLLIKAGCASGISLVMNEARDYAEKRRQQ